MYRTFLPILLIALVACTVRLPQSTPTQLPAATIMVSTETIITLEGTRWLLKTYVDLKGNLIDVLPDTEINITFQNSQMVGSAGCNPYFSEYQVQNDQLGLSPTTSTKKFCTGPEGIMDQEVQYLQTLGTVKRFKIVDGRLQLLDIGGQTVLTFIPMID